MHRRRLLHLSVAAVGVAVAPILTVEEASAIRDRDCDDFRTQRQARKFFRRARKRTGERDAHGLDGDGDGRPCEDLPRR